jgi:hypothetical protein
VDEAQDAPVPLERVQARLFIYNTSNPVLLSASEARAGLLTPLLVTHSGSAFWNNVSVVPFSERSADTHALAERMMFFEPLPFVKRVVFVRTPHRGSCRVSALVMGPRARTRDPSPHVR